MILFIKDLLVKCLISFLPLYFMGTFKYLVFGIIVSGVLLGLRWKKSGVGKELKNVLFKNLKLISRTQILKVFLIIYGLNFILDMLVWPAEILAQIIKSNEKVQAS